MGKFSVPRLPRASPRAPQGGGGPRTVAHSASTSHAPDAVTRASRSPPEKKQEREHHSQMRAQPKSPMLPLRTSMSVAPPLAGIAGFLGGSLLFAGGTAMVVLLLARRAPRHAAVTGLRMAEADWIRSSLYFTAASGLLTGGPLLLAGKYAKIQAASEEVGMDLARPSR